VQEEARKRMMELGALEFIRKPVDNDKLISILHEYDLYSGNKDAGARDDTGVPVDKLDAYREMANVAMGRAGEKLAELLGRFIHLPIPNVNEIATTELHMAVAEIKRNQGVSAVSQGFAAHGINGEAIVMFNDSDMSNMVELLEYDSLENSQALEIEALMDVSNILIGACLLAFSDQLHVRFMQNHPILLGRHMDFEQLLNNTVSRWSQVVAIEIGYSIEGRDIDFDLLFLFPSDAMEMVYSRLVGETDDE
jgi:chemotaxis protein CheY-P-specific phosphatase CheC